MASRYPEVPVIMTTASGSEEVAFQALQAGAASYVPKQAFAEQLAPTVHRIIALAQAGFRRAAQFSWARAAQEHLALYREVASLTEGP